MSFSIGGLASGLDTNTIIKQLMQIESQPYVRLETSKKNITSQQSIFRNLNTKLKAFQDLAFEMSQASTFRGTTSTSSDETVAKVTSTGTASTGDFDLVVNKLAKAHVVQSGSFQAAGDASGLIGQSFTLHFGEGESVNVEVKATENNTYEEVLEDIKKQINSSKAGISAAVIETTDGVKQLVLTSKATGEANRMTFGTAADGSKTVLQDSNGLLNSLGIAENNGEVRESNVAQKYENADIILNGVQIIRSSNTITNAIEGVTINLLKQSDPTEGYSARTKIQVATDTEKIIEKVEEFVNAYNEIVTMVRDNIKKDGKLQGNATLRNLDNQLYNWVNSMVDSAPEGYRAIFELGMEIDKGIKVGSEMTGKMSIDTKVLKKKLEDDPEAFMNFFRGEAGLAKSMDENLKTWTRTNTGILSQTIKGFDSEISFIDDRIEQMSQRLEMKEQSLRKQFTNMEVALAKAQSQQMWLSGQLAQLTASQGF